MRWNRCESRWHSALAGGVGILASSNGQPLQPESSQCCALVIDDSKPVRGILAQMLRELNFQITEAANGQEGLARLREHGQPDVATVNWRMPEMDGLEFIRAVRADPRLRELPLLMISGESEPSQVATALAAGANEYIVKPCTRKTLSEKLKLLGISAHAIRNPSRTRQQRAAG